MKRITIGIVITLINLSATMALAAPAATAKKEASVPCYNGGYTFGLADYSKPLPATKSDTTSAHEQTKIQSPSDSMASQPSKL